MVLLVGGTLSKFSEVHSAIPTNLNKAPLSYFILNSIMLQKGKWRGVEEEAKVEQADKCFETFQRPQEQQFWENLNY